MIVCSEVRNAQKAAPAYAASSAPSHAWFKQQVLAVCGVDPNQKPLGPDCVSVYDWQDDA